MPYYSEDMMKTYANAEAADRVSKEIEGLVSHISQLETAISGIVGHWREFGDMIVFNNAVNKDDYGMGERIDVAAKLVGR